MISWFCFILFFARHMSIIMHLFKFRFDEIQGDVTASTSGAKDMEDIFQSFNEEGAKYVCRITKFNLLSQN